MKEELKKDKEELIKAVYSKHIYSKYRNVNKEKEKVNIKIPPRIKRTK